MTEPVPRRGSAFGAILIIVALVSLPIAILSWGSLLHHRSIERDGLRAQGVVLSKSVIPGNDEDDTAFEIEYSFPIQNGAQIKDSWRIREERWARLYDGATIEIAYRPDDPQKNNFPVGESTFLAAGVMLPIAFSIPPIVVVALVVWGILRRNKTAPDHSLN
jgi:hypothetical protein